MTEHPLSDSPQSEPDDMQSAAAWIKPPKSTQTTELDLDAIVGPKNERVRKLGAGGQGEVWLVQHLGQLEAHKFLPSGGGREAVVFREALHTRSVGHSNIVTVYGMEEYDGAVALRMENIEGKNLADIVEQDGAISVEATIPIALQIADAMQASHERGIVHQDLKPSNLILREDGKSVVVTDFGISAALRDTGSGPPAGTAYFMAPELLKGEGRGSEKSDLWSFGVTLYYLVTTRYPFRFGKQDPVKATAEDPADPTQSILHVSPGFWAIVQRLITRDGTEFETFAAARDALAKYAAETSCPGCPEDVVLPHGDTAAERAASLERQGETALAECRFEHAIDHWQNALAGWQEAGDSARAESLEARLERARKRPREFGLLMEKADDELEAGRLVDAAHLVAAARGNFSRATAMAELRAALRQTLAEEYRSIEESVAKGIAVCDFKAAREPLTRNDQILGDDFARFELERELGERARNFRPLYQEVERKEQAYHLYVSKAEQAINEFNFAKAERAYTLLETEFPDPANVAMLAKLRRAPEQHKTASRYSLDNARRIAQDPTLAATAKKIRIKSTQNACRWMIEEFPPEQFPGVGEFVELKEALEAAKDSIRKYVGGELEKAKEAERATRIFDTRTILQGIEALVVRSDLFDLETRRDVSYRLRAVDELQSRLDKMYNEATAAMAAREYVKAQVALQEIQTTLSDDYKDVPKLLDEAARRRNDVRALGDTVNKELAAIRRGDLENIIPALERAEELFEYSPNDGRKKLLPELAGVCTSVLDAQRKHLMELPDLDGDTMKAYLDKHFLPVIGTLPNERWTFLLERFPDCARAFCRLFSRPHERVAHHAASLKAHLHDTRAVLSVAENVKSLLRECPVPTGSTHPAQDIGELMATAFESASEDERTAHREDAEAVIVQLRDLAPQSVQEALLRQEKAFQAWGTRATLDAYRKQAGEWTRKLWPVGAALVLGLVLWMVFSGNGDTERPPKDDAGGGLPAGLAFERELAVQLGNWFAETPDKKDARLAFLRDWSKLHASGTETTLDDVGAVTSFANGPDSRKFTGMAGEAKDALRDDIRRTTMAICVAALTDAKVELDASLDPGGQPAKRVRDAFKTAQDHLKHHGWRHERAPVDRLARIKAGTPKPSDAAEISAWEFARLEKRRQLVAELVRLIETASEGNVKSFQSLTNDALAALAGLPPFPDEVVVNGDAEETVLKALLTLHESQSSR
ncbi:MAG: protein kinase [Planctomycetota bacterium]